MTQSFDLTVIGGGPGGYVAAIRACQYGLKVAIIEERDMGGTCLNRGCIPTKSLLHSAEMYQAIKKSMDFGINVDGVSFDYKKIAAKKDAVVKQLRQGVEFLVKNNGGLIVKGRAIIKDRNTIEILGDNNQTITTEKMIIATGSRPARPPIPGIEGNKILTSDDVLAMTACPDRITIIGGGVIGVEFATVFNSLGKEVTIVEMMDTILPGVDTEISGTLKKILEKKGIKIYTGAKVTAINSGDNAECFFEFKGAEQKVDSDIVVVAIGRKPNTENIGLENVNVTVEKGFIQVDEKLETTISGIYAIGDVTGKVLLAHVASEQGLIAAANAAGITKKVDYAIVPGCIYTEPEIATVGITEADAIKTGHKVKIGRFPVSANGKSMIMGEKEGLCKIITDEETGEILGAHLMAPRATDMISELSLAMKLEATIEEVSDTIHPHPTVNEIIMEAAHDVDGKCIHKPKK